MHQSVIVLIEEDGGQRAQLIISCLSVGVKGEMTRDRSTQRDKHISAIRDFQGTRDWMQRSRVDDDIQTYLIVDSFELQF